jgi:4'-phosphopantetheinyl transferase EntD
VTRTFVSPEGTCPIAVALRSLRSRIPRLTLAVSAASALDELYPAEDRSTVDMTPARRAEFAAGRSAARWALRAAGHPHPVIVTSDDGVPIFPDGYRGSISHKHWRAVAAVTSATAASGVGVDLEFDDPAAEPDLRGVVVTPSEEPLLQVLRVCEPDLGSPATLLLSAKEAVYKAVFPLRRVRFDFDDLEVALDPKHRLFRALRFPGHRALEVSGRYEIAERWIVCIAIATA